MPITEGPLTAIIFRNDESHFVIGVLRKPDGEELKVKGTIFGARIGTTYRIEYESLPDDPKFGGGMVGKLSSAAPVRPTSIAGIQSMLKKLPGIGEVTALKAVREFGTEAIEKLRDEPALVAEKISGLSLAKAEKIATAVAQRMEEFESSGDLHGLLHSLGPTLIQKSLITWGKNAAEKVRHNPYCLMDLPRVGFPEADVVALGRVGIERDDPKRIEAALRHVVGPWRQQGNTLFSLQQVAREASTFLGLDVNTIATVLRESKTWESWQGSDACQLSIDSLRESKIAQWVLDRNDGTRTHTLDEIPEGLFEELKGDQVEAINGFLRTPNLSIISGPPGTGKTFLVTKVIEIAKLNSLSVMCLAPTGKAAKRMSEMTQHPAMTIHRGLEYKPDQTGEWRFTRDELEPIEADLVIIDEFSMVDTELAWALFRAIAPHTLVLIVGDHRQLPSVGPGSVLRDLMNDVPTMKLTEIKRQDPGGIIKTCHRISLCASPEWHDFNVDDLWMVAASGEEKMVRAVLDLYLRRMPAYCRDTLGVLPGEEMRNIQILTPRRTKHALGADELNRAIRENLLRAGTLRETGYAFAVGERVIQTRNDYKCNRFNGDIGTIVSCSESDAIKFQGKRVKSYVVAWDDNVKTEVPVGDAKSSLSSAFALSIHKSQGSEWPVTILLAASTFGPFYDRPLLYTGLSRASKMCAVVGSYTDFCEVATRPGSQHRTTGLKERLKWVAGRPTLAESKGAK